jgi:competence/damage-inducible protein CinA-like protein
MPTAELIAIGTELLLGEIQDTNTRYLARTLRDLGINIYRATIVGDNLERIAQAIREAMQRCQIIITTGGLGPTVDDPTRAAVALALGVDTEYRPELWEQIQIRFSRYGRAPSENNRRQAWIPAGSIPVENPVGTAPAFICETVNSCIISLPGVPREMEYLTLNVVLPYLRDRFQLTGTIKARVLHVAGVGESTIDDWVGELMTSANPTVGLLAHPGQVDVRITAKADSLIEADAMLDDMETRVRECIQEGLFGSDQATLEDTVLQALRDQNWKAVLVEAGLDGALRARMEQARFPIENTLVMADPLPPDALHQAVDRFQQQCRAETALGISLHPAPDKHTLYIYVVSPSGAAAYTRSYGGERALSPAWSVNNGLEMLRRKIVESLTGENGSARG